MSLTDAISVTRNDVWQGCCYPVVGNLASFPGELESIINPTTYALAAGLTAMSPTTEDGVTIGRSVDVTEGIAIDQKRTNLGEGEPSSWAMMAGMTLVNTTVEMFRIAWETSDYKNLTGSAVTQKVLPISAPATFTTRQLYIIQEDPATGLIRAWAFRDAVPQPEGEVNVQSEEASQLPVTFKIREDTSIAAHHGSFGKLFEEQA